MYILSELKLRILALMNVHNSVFFIFRFTLSVWVYIVEYCPSVTHRLCSIIQRLMWDDVYLTPLVYINRLGIRLIISEKGYHSDLWMWHIKYEIYVKSCTIHTLWCRMYSSKSNYSLLFSCHCFTIRTAPYSNRYCWRLISGVFVSVQSSTETMAAFGNNLWQ